MGTQKQKKVAKLIVENSKLDKPLNGGEILEKTGYAPGVIKNPSDILKSAGVKEELRILGFDEETAKTVVGQILKNDDTDPSTRLRAADQVFKVFGTYAAEKKEINVQGNIDVKDKRAIELGNKYEEELKQSLNEAT